MVAKAGGCRKEGFRKEGCREEGCGRRGEEVESRCRVFSWDKVDLSHRWVLGLTQREPPNMCFNYG